MYQKLCCSRSNLSSPLEGLHNGFNYSVNEVDMKTAWQQAGRHFHRRESEKARLLITAAESRRNATWELHKSPVNAISNMKDGFDSNTNCFVPRHRFLTNDPPNALRLLELGKFFWRNLFSSSFNDVRVVSGIATFKNCDGRGFRGVIFAKI